MTHGNYQKYTNPNPVQQWLIRRFLQAVGELVEMTGARTVLDVGCAEGFVAAFLQRRSPGLRIIGVDRDITALARGRQLHPAFKTIGGDALALPFEDDAVEMALCTEVLEHIPEVDSALEELRRVSRHWLVASVPWEPWFRVANVLRLKNLDRWGDDPEHVNHWTGRAFRRLLAGYGHIVAYRVSFPWQLVCLEWRKG